MRQQPEPYSRLDRALATFLARLAKLDEQDKARFKDIVSELSQRQNHGHSCLVLDQQTQQLMRQSCMVSEQGQTALILEQDRLYLQRYWRYETRLAMRIKTMAGKSLSVEHLDRALPRYFNCSDGEFNWQREAAKNALQRYFCIISGGPGTGKTTTVVRILALVQELSPQPLHIALAAPTGKAAMRLQESIAMGKQDLPCSETVKALIPETVTTIHRLLGVIPASPYFHHDADNPLPHDLLIIDEASMIDLALMCKVCDALKPQARLILLGDKDQLASVESGAVLADISSALTANTIQLQKSYRFERNIRALADVVNVQQDQQAWYLLNSGGEDLELLESGVICYIAEQQKAYLQLIKSAVDFALINRAFNAFQVLCATRHGNNSSEEVNRLVEQRLVEQGLISVSGRWYNGRPVMVTQNDAAMQLFNGDIGICLRDPELDKLQVYFERADGSIKKYLPSRLPHSETVFAMTIHKSQGSEFDEVLIALPDVINPLLTKELLYTAITRARKAVKISASREIFLQTLQQRVKRNSGLAEKLN